MELFYPTVCPFCGQLIKEGICDECREKIRYVEEPRCKKCGKQVRTEEQEYCLDCQKHKHYFEEGRNLWIHRSPVNEAIYAWKYQNRKVYTAVFAKELAEHYAAYVWKKRVDCIVPIPLHKKRQRKRGYNQSRLLAEELGKRLNIPVRSDALVRKKETMPQKELNDKERKRNIRGVFAVGHSVFPAKTVLLIDDIYTTGSTLDEAAKTLKAGGIEKVYFLTISIGQGF